MLKGFLASVNGQPYKSSTKGDFKLMVRKLVQYAKLGSCGKNMPIPVEFSWFSLNRDGKNVRVTPESLLTLGELNAMFGSEENECDRGARHSPLRGCSRAWRTSLT